MAGEAGACDVGDRHMPAAAELPAEAPTASWRCEEVAQMSLEEGESEALKLDPGLRAKLAEKLLRSLEDLSDEENERLWAEEALRRQEEIETGAVKARPGRVVFRDAHSRLH
jgi:hypothetical protein